MSKQAIAVLKSWARVFLAAILTAYLTHLAAGGDPVSAPWQTILIAGIVAVGPVILRWLDAGDTAYGRGYTPPVAVQDAAAD